MLKHCVSTSNQNNVNLSWAKWMYVVERLFSFNFSKLSSPHYRFRRKSECLISWTCRNAGLHRSVFPCLSFPPIASFCLLQTMKTLTGTKQSVENARQAFSYSSARAREMLSAPFPYSPGRMCKIIPTVRIQSRPLTHIFQFLKSLNETINSNSIVAALPLHFTWNCGKNT